MLVVKWKKILGIIQEIIGLLILMELVFLWIGKKMIGLGLIKIIGKGLNNMERKKNFLLQEVRIYISKL